MVKLPRSSEFPSTLFPPRWTSTYEARTARAAQRVSMDSERLAFFRGRAGARLPRDFSRPAQTRLAAAHLLPPDRVSLRSARGSNTLAGIRSPAHLLFHGESRQSF